MYDLRPVTDIQYFSKYSDKVCYPAAVATRCSFHASSRHDVYVDGSINMQGQLKTDALFKSRLLHVDTPPSQMVLSKEAAQEPANTNTLHH